MKKQNANDTALLLRLPTELKDALQRQAELNGRRITSEVNIRLKESLAKTAGQGAPDRSMVMAQQEPGAYTTQVDTTATERAMLQVFRALPPEKQLALLSLFK